ncbi:Mis12-domain-containing protein [Saitoella complicata NRRL Y-17804]|uniref:Mis12 domain-containing protein n=1 Tax=Saitoella complicata (strain BCRC 22490 / CBS 7301 / JCM 7358 / NBRC 10748 / NRRL Y-17804) TaxID=698492 RepID=A0A0E9NJ94_SAICN|nr:Mis12-domain-containing protein [Saitoella complicata NRRL Y-17804]ODQ54878.1 Mis12-domain-containing protein [Saitoella complicata NRRL Y-17804]GAO49776.1 hypothetical protein G7K_3918-t1 [Saitoella complicata NRRL Y-17804]
MASDARSELITEHFEHVPLSFIDDVINSANAILYKAVNAMESFIQSQPNVPPDESEQGIHQLETLLENAVDRNFDAFELYTLRNIFNVPDDVVGWMRLGHHEGLEFGVQREEEDEVEKELKRVRAELEKAEKRQKRLRVAKKENTISARYLEKHLERLSFLSSAASANEVTPLHETTDFLTDQLSTLKTLLEELRKIAPSALEDVDEVEDERSQYVERMVKKRVRGSRDNDDGFDWEGEERKIRKIGNVEDAKVLVEALREQGMSKPQLKVEEKDEEEVAADRQVREEGTIEEGKETKGEEIEERKEQETKDE